MSEQELKAAVKAAVSEAMAERDSSCRRCCDTCDLEPGEHRDDHQFVQGCRKSIQEGGKAAVGMIVKGLFVVIGLGLLTLIGVKLGIHGK